jgi:iron(III) transport system permease protein
MRLLQFPATPTRRGTGRGGGVSSNRCTLVGYLLARRETAVTGALDGTLMIPYIVPGVVVGLGFVVTFDQPPLLLTGSALIIVLILFIRRLPYAVRSIASILRQVKGSIEEAAISLGAPPGRAFLKVTLPLMLPGIVAGALLSFITAINEPSSTLVLYVGRTMTMPVRIHLSVLDGEFGTAAALSTILLPTTGIAVFVVFESRRQRKRVYLKGRACWPRRRPEALSSSSAWRHADKRTNSPNRAL